MAIIPIKTLRDSLQATLNDTFAGVYEENVWAVHFDYCHADMTYKIARIEPWWLRTPSGSHMVQRIAGAVDEMDAYKKFMERIDKNHQAESGSIIDQKAVRDD